MPDLPPFPQIQFSDFYFAVYRQDKQLKDLTLYYDNEWGISSPCLQL